MKTTKIFISLFLALFCAGTTLNAQVRIGENNTPRTGTLLDLKSTFVGGLLLPNVSITDLSKIPADFSDASVQSQDTNADLKGMIVYNTNTSTGEGVYVWDGNDWKSVGSGLTLPEPPATPGTITITPSTISLGGTVILSVPADPNATSYVWTLPNGLTGTSSTNTIAITGAIAGTYPAGSIKVKAVNSGGSSAERSSATAITVNPCSVAPATPGTITLSATTVNQNGTFTASVTAVSSTTSYTWTLPSGLTGTSTTNSITITANTAGSIAASGITVTANNACGSSAAKAGAGTITVNPCSAAPATPGTISLSATTVNLNGTFIASVTAVSGATSYTWALPSGLTGTSTTNSITITANMAGSIAASGITVTANNACGSSAAKAGAGTITVNNCTVAPAQPGAINLSATTVSLNGTFTASVTAVSGATSYTWTLPGGLTGSSTINSITITGSAIGTYTAGTIKVKAVNACGSSAERSSATAVTVNSPGPANTFAIANGVYVQKMAGYVPTSTFPDGSSIATILDQFTATGKTLYVATNDEPEMNWANANATCAAKGSGWRLPTLGESANMQGKSGAPTSTPYWSSTEVSTTRAWCWGFNGSGSGYSNKTGNPHVRCVWSD